MVTIHPIYIGLLLMFCVLVTPETNEKVRGAPLLRCSQVYKKARPRFHLVRRCARSDLRIIITANFSSQWRCSEFAMYKRGLAINFGWLTGEIGHCEVLECPEHDTLESLRRRENYDYYSLYANPLPSMDWTCVPKVGMFRIGGGESRSTGRRKCQEWARMPTPRNKTEGDKKTAGSPDQTGMQTAVATSRPDYRYTQLQPSNLPASLTLPSSIVPVQDLPTPPPVPPFSPFEETNPFAPPFIHPSGFPEGFGFGDPSLWNPEFRLGESLNSSNVSDAKSYREAGQLANVLSQGRTTNLTTFLVSKAGKYFASILVGLASIPGNPSVFATPDGEPLPCFRFRAWAPGHPLSPKRLKTLRSAGSSDHRQTTYFKTNSTAKANSTNSNSTSTTTSKPKTMNNGTKNESTNVAEQKQDEMTLCVYLHRDSLWHTSLCSTKTLFLCEILPSGGPCRDANTTEKHSTHQITLPVCKGLMVDFYAFFKKCTDERAECEYEKVGTKEDRCSAWNGKMITTTMMTIEPDKDSDDDKDNGIGDDDDVEDDNRDEDNSDTNEDDNDNNNYNEDYDDNEPPEGEDDKMTDSNNDQENDDGYDYENQNENDKETVTDD